ncbi:MAG: adenylate/guanylate cyclase domain-containing protein [Myxococcota bacterium]
MWRPTLARALTLALLGAAAVVGWLGARALSSSEQTLLESAEALRRAKAEHVSAEVERELGAAAEAVEDLARAERSGLVDGDLGRRLYAAMLAHPRLVELSLTFAEPEPEAEIAVVRRGEGLDTLRVRGVDAEFRGTETHRSFDGTKTEVGALPDPRAHLTFATTASVAGDGLLWTDLSYAQFDDALPEAERRVVVSAMRRVLTPEGHFLGVVRAGLDIQGLDALVRAPLESDDAHQIFLADTEGRPITRVRSGQAMIDEDGDLRPDRQGLSPALVAALNSPARAEAAEQGQGGGDFQLDGERYLVSYRRLLGSQDWLIGVVVPARIYTRALEPIVARLRLSVALVLAAVILGGLWLGRRLERSFRQVTATTERMAHFDFAPAQPRSAFRDLEAVGQSLERAKTALRALTKFVPLELVQQIYRENQEPVLGGALAELSVMFTDIRDFTTVSEAMPTDALARALGRYLETMTRAVRAEQGTIDKFIGDAVMALFNAPAPIENDAAAACRAALACLDATARLYQDPEWGDRPCFYTRVGIHRDRVMVGNFGAPERMSYTALGDGVNLAARLEGLCKAYGVQILVSEAIVRAAGPGFVFRPIDRVAVKGRAGGVQIFELVGTTVAEATQAVHQRYAEALTAYQARAFKAAAQILEAQAEDPPSAALARRCRELEVEPPPPDWDGIFIHKSK